MTYIRGTDKPTQDPKIDGDPLKTLFLARLSYDITEKDLEQEFSRYGPIEKARFVERSWNNMSMLTRQTGSDRQK
jgi:RNA recognition motif-containing protein